MITIGVKWIDVPGAHNEYCGQGSVFGNPYATKGMTQEQRDIACERYIQFFRKEANTRSTGLREGVKRLLKLHRAGVDINLQCFCTGKRCHCETIKLAIEQAA